MTRAFTESIVEQAALARLESVDRIIRNGAEFTPGVPAAERGDSGQVVLSGELRAKDAERFIGRAV